MARSMQRWLSLRSSGSEALICESSLWNLLMLAMTLDGSKRDLLVPFPPLIFLAELVHVSGDDGVGKKILTPVCDALHR